MRSNEPKGTRTPLRIPFLKKTNTSNLQQLVVSTASADEADTMTDGQVTALRAPTTSRSKSQTNIRTPRAGSKKASAAAEQARRERYAQEVFDELNEKVFAGGLPEDTRLHWNNRLLTTAGRAKWHR